MVMKAIESAFGSFQNKNTYWRAMQAGKLAEFDQAYEAAVDHVRTRLLGRELPLEIDGKPVTVPGGWYETRSPCDADLVIAKVPKATAKEARAALAAAKKGAKAWAAKPWKERAALLDKAADLFTRDFYELCAIMTFEAGKTRFEASIDVDEAIDFLRFYALTMREMNGFDMEMGRPFPNERCRSVLKPFGVFSVICPFNFPVAITTGMTAGALVTGNTTVMKPSMKGVLSGWKCHGLLREAGIPGSALQLVMGPGREVAETLTSDTIVDGIVFTGSKEVGFKVIAAMGERDPQRPVIAEMGGKNAIIVTAKADLAKAVEGCYRSAFGFQGQKCSAASRILVDKSIADGFIKDLVRRTQGTAVDLPWKKDAFMGPIIEDYKLKVYEEWAARVKKDGGKVLAGGVRETKGPLAKGTFVQPTLVTGLPREHPLFSTELFLPFAGIWTVDGLEDAVRLANNVEYGLTAGIFTEDAKEADYFFEHIEAGVTYLNRKAGGSTAAVVNGQSFGGWKHSGSTGIGAGGRYYLTQFMREQSQTRCID